MTPREMGCVAFRTMAIWLIVTGLAAACASLIAWDANVTQHGREATLIGLAQSAIYVPVGALLWLASSWAAGVGFPEQSASEASAPGRPDLYAFASVLVGLYLLSDALSQIVYWIVVWRSSGGTNYWAVASSWTTEETVVYRVHAQARAGEAAAKLILGSALVLGPERLRAVLARVRGELSGSLAEPEGLTEKRPEKSHDGV